MVGSEQDFYRDKRILITGGLGFIGSSLAIELVRHGAIVTLLDGMIPDLGANWFNIDPIKDKVTVAVANLADSAATDYYAAGQDIIFNIGMHSSHLDSMKSPLYDLETNVKPQLLFLESIRRVNPTVRIVYIGSRAQFGPVKQLPINEQSLLNPADIYAAGKQVVEWYHLLYQGICGLRPTSLRLGNTYGPRHQMKHAKYGVQNFLIRLAMENQEIQVFGEGQQRREMIYIEDVIDAIMHLGSNERTIGEVYCIGVNEKITFLDLVKEIISACGRGSYRHVPWPKDRENIEVGDVDTDFSKLTTHIGWQPRTTLCDGLRRTVDYYSHCRQNYW